VPLQSSESVDSSQRCLSCAKGQFTVEVASAGRLSFDSSATTASAAFFINHLLRFMPHPVHRSRKLSFSDWWLRPQLAAAFASWAVHSCSLLTAGHV
jgi:hypothetical protein